ncbi:MAG: thioredoxin domain-containing protein [Acidobacteria bacterium]|nr:thioredoxin domain-containing protein [Acidobacteriota bacterium]
MNRLAREKSPYLLQHADNPVDWYPWGDEAFGAARRRDCPIFLSIGYSTCHWCHVMEHESFEDASIAAVLNESYVPIKVDREERPDVDRVYMTFVQATTGSGGWPMNVWLTPDLKPFFAGTYFPPSSRWGRPGFAEVLGEIARMWRDERQRVTHSADSLTERLRAFAATRPDGLLPGPRVLTDALAHWRQAFDPRNGGFGGAPKFPRPCELLFLFREHARTGDEQAREMATRTLEAMALGGMRDHVGGGFHRYSVDAEWRIPHFEKMLYDQAQLVLAYLEAAQITGNVFCSEVAADTLDYVLRDLRDPGGAFYSAEDADSVPPESKDQPGAHKMEGAFYLWRDAEIAERLGDSADFVRIRFGVRPQGNAPSDPQGEFIAKNHLFVSRSIDEVARMTATPVVVVGEALRAARRALFEARQSRPRPHLDDKILTAWNGLMIAALARAGRVLGPGVRHATGLELVDRRYARAAIEAAEFILTRLWDPSRQVMLRRYRDGEAAIDGYAEDYAFMIWALLELFESDGDPRWLEWAIRLQDRQDTLFWDEAGGGWFSTTGTDPSVLLRMKEDYDGAEPTPTSVSALNVLKLHHLTGHATFLTRAERTLAAFGSQVEQAPRGVPMMLAALSSYHAGLRQIVIVGDSEAEDTAQMRAAVADRFLPFSVVVPTSAQALARLARSLPFVEGMRAIDDRATAYVCQEFACRRPTNDVAELVAELELCATVVPDSTDTSR